MNTESTVRILFLSDVDRILRILYEGSRPPGVKFLICSCGRHANLEMGDAQAIGWQILPHPACPTCIAHEPYQGPARDRFIELVDRLTTGKEGV
jgi:hypothetical protein